MRRIDTATKAVDLFGAGKHGFKDGDPALAILATKLNAAFFNSVQEELANLIELSGQTLNPADNTQLYQAVQLLGAALLSKSVAGGSNVTLTTAESRNTIILLTGVLAANINVIVPAAGRQWIIVNNTTGAFTVTVKTAAGSGVVVTQGGALQLYCDGSNVAQVGVATGVQPGEVSFFARNTPPAGYLKANGALVSRTTYAALFAAIGTTWGAGDGATTFALPDGRGEFFRGWDDGRGVDATRIFGSSQLDAAQGHDHSPASAAFSTANPGAGNIGWDATGASVDSNSRQKTTMVNDGVNGEPRISTETRPRNIALLACIKY